MFLLYAMAAAVVVLDYFHMQVQDNNTMGGLQSPLRLCVLWFTVLYGHEWFFCIWLKEY